MYFRHLSKNPFKKPLDNENESAKMLISWFWPTKIHHPCSPLSSVILMSRAAFYRAVMLVVNWVCMQTGLYPNPDYQEDKIWCFGTHQTHGFAWTLSGLVWQTHYFMTQPLQLGYVCQDGTAFHHKRAAEITCALVCMSFSLCLNSGDCLIDLIHEAWFSGRSFIYSSKDSLQDQAM